MTAPAPDTVWTAAPGVTLRREGAEISLPRPFTRLDVIGADSALLQVRCNVCGDTAAAWVGRHEVVHEAPLQPSTASTVAEFALAIRRAAARHDLAMLQPLMATDFTFGAIHAYGRDRALASWVSENFRTLDRVPQLLDRGLAPLGNAWVAPPEFASRFEYQGVRLGFQRTPAGRWEWMFIVQGEMQ